MPISISFRPLSRSDFPLLLEWLSAPHVAAWWHETLDLASVHAKYGGERAMTGLGLGPTAIREFLRQIVFRDPGVSAVITDPEEHNLRSLRAFQKVGFTITKTVQLASENFKRQVVRIDRPQA
jgi:RimJ/RimL family protein N-acetyltransferase